MIAFWHFLFGWPSLSILVGVAATSVAILEPKQLDAITDLRKWAIVIAVVAFSLTAIMGHYYYAGVTEINHQWNDAVATETVNGEAARDDADRTIGPLGNDRSLFDNDPFNRNRGKQRSGQ